MTFQTWRSSLRKNIWSRTITRVLKEVWIPAALALSWTIYSLSLKKSWNLPEAVQLFGGTFFVLGYFANYFIRSLKLVKDDDRHKDVINQQQLLLGEMQATAKSVASYATGGDGFAAVWFARVQAIGLKNHIYELCYKVEGGYPLYDVNVRFSNMDDPVIHAEIRNGNMQSFNNYVHLGNIVPGFSYSIRTSIPILDRTPNRIHINWHARNGSWYQRFELALIENEWKMATFVKRGDEEIMNKSINGYDSDEDGRPKFDLSLTALDHVEKT